jgi:hypothetical protein
MMGRAVVRMAVMRNAYKLMLDKHEEKRLLVRYTDEEDNIKMDLK